MTYGQTLYRLPLYAALATTLVGAAGCASTKSVRDLSDRFSAFQAQTQRSVDNLDTRVTASEQKPNAERVVMIKKGQGLDELYGWMRGQILPQYKDPAARKEAEDNGNAVVLIPTGLKDKYYAVVAEDADKDGLPSKGDYKFVDVVGDKQQVVQFVVDKKNLPELLRWQLINAVSAKPLAPPVKQQEKKPFIRRRQSIYTRPQVGYRARSRI